MSDFDVKCPACHLCNYCRCNKFKNIIKYALKNNRKYKKFIKTLTEFECKILNNFIIVEYKKIKHEIQKNKLKRAFESVLINITRDKIKKKYVY